MSDIDRLGNKPLYEICDDLAIYQETLEYVESQLAATPDDGLLLEQHAEVIAGRDTLADLLVSKTDATAHVLRTLRHEDEVVLAEEEKRIHARRKRVQAALGWLKGYVMSVMKNRGIKALKTPLNTIRIQANGGKQALVIDTLEDVPLTLGRYSGSFSDAEAKYIWELCDGAPQAIVALERLKWYPDTDLIRAELEAGREVPGARLADRGESLRVA